LLYNKEGSNIIVHAHTHYTGERKTIKLSK